MHMNITRRVLGRCGVSDAVIDDLIDEVRYGGEGTLWRQTVLAWITRKRGVILITAAVAVLYRIGIYVPVPGVNATAIAVLREPVSQEALGLTDIVTGGNASRITVFTLGVLPYIYGSMFVQLGVGVRRVLFPRTSAPSARQIAQASRIAAVVLCVLQSRALAWWLEAQSRVPLGLQLVDTPGWSFQLLAVVTLTTGTAMFMWLTDSITKRGTANGMLIVFIAGVIAGLADVGAGIRAQPWSQFLTLVLTVVGVAFVARGYRVALQESLPVDDRQVPLMPLDR
jgi:preprotein translocase subunit SecY